jgi:hypothetical protein
MRGHLPYMSRLFMFIDFPRNQRYISLHNILSPVVELSAGLGVGSYWSIHLRTLDFKGACRSFNLFSSFAS